MSDRPALPESFVRAVKQQFQQHHSEALLSALADGQPPVSIQLNRSKFEVNLGLKAVPWASDAYYLAERPTFTQDPLFHAGAYYVQEASSMVISKVFEQVRPHEPVRILDLCAAPGGKSVQLLSKMQDEDLLVANEVVNSRARILRENLVKWGSEQVIVSNNDPADFGSLPGFFDILLIDAPCSGEGMFRKDTGAVAEWSEEHVTLCCGRQKRIIADVWDCLAENGVLIYSTCTFNSQENEEILDWLTKTYETEPIALNLNDFGMLTYQVGSYTGFKMLPGLVNGEGFCFFVLRKTGGYSRKLSGSGKKARRKRTNNMALRSINSMESLHTFERDGAVFATRFYPEMDELKKHLNLIRSGVLIGEMKQNKLIPSHEFAMNRLLDPVEWPQIALNYEQALSYLMKEPFDLPQAERGFNLLTFRNMPLGWINHLGNRFNSLYPSGWRIHKDFRKEPPFSIEEFIRP